VEKGSAKVKGASGTKTPTGNEKSNQKKSTAGKRGDGKTGVTDKIVFKPTGKLTGKERGIRKLEERGNSLPMTPKGLLPKQNKRINNKARNY